MKPLLCYLVGGAVRDKLLDLPVKDRDWVVIGSNPEEMLALGFTAVGHQFPVFLHPQTHEEYALARTERKQGQGYHGFECFTGEAVTLEQDLSRRDLTINAIAATVENDQLIDPFHGQADIQARCLRHVTAAFAEDPLRVLRVARFRAQLGQFGFQLHPETERLMISMSQSGELQALTSERVWKEIYKALISNHPQFFWQTLADVNALPDTLPIFAQLHADKPRWEASLAALQQSVSVTPSAEIRFACWCHLLTTHEITALRKQLKAPHIFLDYAQLLVLLMQNLNKFSTQSTEDLWLLLKTLNVQRKNNRFADLLLSLTVIHQSSENQNIATACDYLKKAAAILDHVDIQGLIQQKLNGAQLGMMIKQRSLELLQQLQTDFFKREVNLKLGQ
jgi:tRNA nucleotidyltransferase (CCA-adding enzyme)